MMNLIHHENDFKIKACWTFTATGHGKGPCDGIGASVKSSANRSILKSDTTLSSVQDFFNLTRNLNEDAAKLNNTSEPPINTYYLKSTTVDEITNTLLSHRFKNISGNKCYFLQIVLKNFLLGRIKDIRQFHQFDPKDRFTILCRKTSNSLVVEEFTIHNSGNDEKEESPRRIRTKNDISIDQIVFLEHNNKQYLAKVIQIKESQKEAIVQCYEPSFPISSYIRFFNKMETNLNISWKNIIASFSFQPTFGRRNQLSLSKEQFLNIQKCCT
jgi:hypothetical protein